MVIFQVIRKMTNLSKCVFISALITIGLSGPLLAQENAFSKGDVLVNAGLSLGYYGYGFAGSRSGFTVPVTISAEYGITEDISVGPYVGFARWRYDFLDDNYSWRFLTIGGRGTYHLTSLLNEITDGDLDQAKLDLYGSLLLGAEIRSYNGPDLFPDEDDTDVVIRLGPVLGVRYYVNPRVGLYFEGGRGTFGYLNFGVTFDL